MYLLLDIRNVLAARELSKIVNPPSNFVALELKNTPDYYVAPSTKNAYKTIVAPLTAEQIAIRQKVVEAFPDKPVMWDIAQAESRFRNVYNTKYTNESGYYTAGGVFQITRTTYKRNGCGDPSERMDIDKNIACAKKIAENNPSLSDWDESSANW